MVASTFALLDRMVPIISSRDDRETEPLVVTSRLPDWWNRRGLLYKRDHLWWGGRDLTDIASAMQGPTYVYDLSRVRANLRRLQKALRSANRRSRVFYAMKSNRHPRLLAALREAGVDGIDVCSPAELARAMEIGFALDRISYTGNSMSNADADVLAQHEGVVINCDSLSSLRKIGSRCPGRRVGIRINPEIGVGYRQNAKLQYAGQEVTKFGVPWSRLSEAWALAKQLGLVVDGLHVHAGCGFLTPQLSQLERVLKRIAKMASSLPGLRYVNLGGGLGIPLRKGDRPLDLAGWTAQVKKHFGASEAEVWIEPGDYLAKDAGVLLLEVTEVEPRGERVFVGLNGGFNLHPEPVFYDLPLEPLPIARRSGRRRRVTLAGNINEAHDLWARDTLLPPLAEGDGVAVLNAGGYGASMASNHCMRGEFSELVLS